MTEFGTILDRVGLTRRAAADVLGVNYATAKRWASGSSATPRAVMIVMEALAEGELTLRWIRARFDVGARADPPQ
jgi:hypothetical protein